MKKLFLLMSMAAAMISFAGCQKNEFNDGNDLNVEGGSTFELVADIAHTKTSLDVENGYKVDWESGDIIYMVTSDGTWGKPYTEDKGAETIAEFTYDDGKFTTDATIADGEYTFKGMYAVASQKSYHRGASSTHKLDATQTQNCENPTAHIKANDALVGTFTATVPMAETAQMTMSHLYTLMQVDVKNATGSPIEITKFEMTAVGADLAAIFNVEDFDTPAIKTKQDKSSTITVNVTGGAVEDNASLPVYFVMAPLSDYKGDVTFKVTDSEGNTYTKSMTMSSGISFAAGTYNTTPYTIKTADVVAPEPEQPAGTVEATLSFADVVNRTSFSTDQQVWEQNGIKLTNKKAGSTSNVADYSNPARFYKNSTIEIEAPGKITKMVFNCKEGAADLKTAVGDNAKVSNNTTVTIELDGTSSTVTYKLTAGKVFVYSLVVNYEAGNSEGGETPEPEPEPEPVQLIMSDITCTAQTENSLTFTWSNVANATGYEVTCNNKTETVTSTEYTATDLKAGTQYEVSIKAIGDDLNYITSVAKIQTGTTAIEQGGGESDEPVVVLFESFAASTGTMGWSGNAASGTFKADNIGWSCVKEYGAGGSAKFGTGSAQGSATTPAFGHAGDMVLTFKAGAWDGSSEQTTLQITINNGGSLSVTSVTMAKGKWTEYTVNITGATANTTVTFKGKQAKNSRFLLDDVKIVKN